MDTTAPMLTEFSLTANVDGSSGIGTLTIEAEATDKNSGIDDIVVYLNRDIIFETTNSTTPLPYPSDRFGLWGIWDSWEDGRSSKQFDLYSFSPAGTYEIARVEVTDNADNEAIYYRPDLERLGFSTSFEFRHDGSDVDVTAPRLTSFEMTDVVRVSRGSGVLVISAETSDAGIGTNDVLVRFDKDITYRDADYEGSTPREYNFIGLWGIGDDWRDGASTERNRIFDTTPIGTYRIVEVEVTDWARNERVYSAGELASLGFDTQFKVVDQSTVLYPRAPVFGAMVPGDIRDGGWRGYGDITGVLSATDANADALEFSIVTGSSGAGSNEVTKVGSFGTLTLDVHDGTYVYEPNAQSIVSAARSPSDMFIVTVSDGRFSDVDVLTFGVFEDYSLSVYDPNEDGKLLDAAFVTSAGDRVSGDALQLYRTYGGVLGRTPDPGGFQFYTEKIANGEHDLYSMTAGFLWSKEFMSFFPGVDRPTEISSSDFVRHIYTNVFGRDPDAGGFAYWTNELDSGYRDQANVAVSMTQSNEFVALTAIEAVDYLIG